MSTLVILLAIFGTATKANPVFPQWRSWNFRESRIVGGVKTSIEDLPYQVSLLANNFATCGGSIISRDYVLTAAHCAKIGNLKVRAGSNFTGKGGSLHEVIKAIAHENFTFYEAPRNDIALLRVKPPFVLDATRKPVILHWDEDFEDGELGTVSGFGRVRENGLASDQLRSVGIRIVDRTICSQKYIDLGFTPVEEDFICGGVSEGGKDSCQGDSGGPFVVNGRLAGIVSYGVGCGRPEIPGVYTNVAYFRDWITKITRLHPPPSDFYPLQ